MDPALLFLLAVYLVPLGLVSGMAAWAENRFPILALILWVSAAGLLIWVALTRDEGLFAFRDIPELTIALVARLMALF